MKTKIQLVFLTALMGLSVSCKKNNTAGPSSTTKKLKYLTQQVTTDSSASGVFTAGTITYSYNSKNQLSSQNSGASVITYGYTDDGRLVSITNTRANTTTYTKELDYTDGKPTSAVYEIYTSTAAPTTDTYGLVFNGNNMTELHTNGDHGLNLIIYSFDSSNNMTKISVNQGDNVNEYTYDNKKSRFTNMPPSFKNAFASSYTGVFTSSPEASSANNIISQKANSGAITNYTYTYDSDGYPTTRRTVTGVVTTKDTFTYSER